MTCLPPDPDTVLVSLSSMRIAVLLVLAAWIGLTMLTLWISIERDPGPPPKGMQ